MSWDHLGKTVNTFVEERLLSPLLGTFAISWCAWNYKFLVILFSAASVTTTFQLIEAYAFPNLTTLLLKGFAAPLATTLAYVYFYPWPARVVFEAWRKSQLEIAKIRRKYDEETPVSHAEARELRAARYRLEEELEKSQQQLAQLRADYNEFRRLHSQNLERSAEVGSPSASSPQASERKSGDASLSAEERLVLELLEKSEGREELAFLLAAIAGKAGGGKVKAEFLLEELRGKGLVDRDLYETDTFYFLTQEGRRELFHSGE